MASPRQGDLNVPYAIKVIGFRLPTIFIVDCGQKALKRTILFEGCANARNQISSV
jgi:hypothetical protein